jgi:hypothetical protein
VAGIDSTTARARHDVGGTRLEEVLTPLRKPPPSRRSQVKGGDCNEQTGQGIEGGPEREERRRIRRRHRLRLKGTDSG